MTVLVLGLGVFACGVEALVRLTYGYSNGPTITVLSTQSVEPHYRKHYLNADNIVRHKWNAAPYCYCSLPSPAWPVPLWTTFELI